MTVVDQPARPERAKVPWGPRGTAAATFCAVTTLLTQLEAENHVDVYQYAKVAHNRRPGIWKCQDDYLYLYRVAEATCIQMEHIKKGHKQHPVNNVSPQRKKISSPPHHYHSSGGSSSNGHHLGNGHYSIRVPPDGMESSVDEGFANNSTATAVV